jgi:hypothetical protein
VPIVRVQGDVMKAIFAVFAAAMLLAGCQTQGGREISAAEFDAPVPAGTTRLSFEPNKDRWVLFRRENGAVFKASFRCRPLACEKHTVLVYSNSRSPTRSPDPAALKNLAEKNVEELRREGSKNVSYRLAPMKGYPAFWVDATSEIDGKKVEVRSVQAFVGATIVGFVTLSEDGRVSRRHLDEAVGSLTIKDGGRLPASR